MMWSYVQLADETQIAYSDLREDGTLEVAVERPVDMGFDSARCMLPAHRWFDVTGFSGEEMAELDSFVRNNAPLIFETGRASCLRAGDCLDCELSAFTILIRHTACAEFLA